MTENLKVQANSVHLQFKIYFTPICPCSLDIKAAEIAIIFGSASSLFEKFFLHLEYAFVNKTESQALKLPVTARRVPN